MKPHTPHTIDPKLRYARIARAEIAAKLAQEATRKSRETVWKNIRRDIRRGRATFGNPLVDKLILSLGQSVLRKPDLLENIAQRTKRNVTALQEADNVMVFVVEYEEQGMRRTSFAQDSIGLAGSGDFGSLMPRNTGNRSQFLIFAGITSGDDGVVVDFIDSILPRKPKNAKELLATSSGSKSPIKLPFQKFVMVDTSEFMSTEPGALPPVHEGQCLVNPENTEHLQQALLGLQLHDFELYIWGSCLCRDDLAKDDRGNLLIHNVQSGNLQQCSADIHRALKSLGWGLETALV